MTHDYMPINKKLFKKSIKKAVKKELKKQKKQINQEVNIAIMDNKEVIANEPIKKEVKTPVKVEPKVEVKAEPVVEIRNAPQVAEKIFKPEVKKETISKDDDLSPKLNQIVLVYDKSKYDMNIVLHNNNRVKEVVVYKKIDELNKVLIFKQERVEGILQYAPESFLVQSFSNYGNEINSLVRQKRPSAGNEQLWYSTYASFPNNFPKPLALRVIDRNYFITNNNFIYDMKNGTWKRYEKYDELYVIPFKTNEGGPILLYRIDNIGGKIDIPTTSFYGFYDFYQNKELPMVIDHTGLTIYRMIDGNYVLEKDNLKKYKLQNNEAQIMEVADPLAKSLSLLKKKQKY